MRTRYPCLLWLFVMLSNIAVAQSTMQQKADSLQRLITAAKTDDTAKGRQLALLSDVLRYTDSAGAVRAARQALAIQTRHGFAAGIAQARFGLGNIYKIHNNDTAAETQYRKGLDAVAKDTSAFGIGMKAKLTSNLGTIYGDRGMAEKELELALSIIPMFEKIKDTIALAVTHNNVGAKFYNAGEKEKAFAYFRKSIALHNGRPSDYLTDTYIIAAWCAHDLDSLNAMRRYLDEAQKALALRPSPDLETKYHIAEGLYLYEKEKYSEAIDAYRRAEKVGRANNQLFHVANALDGLHDVYNKQRQYSSAKKTMEDYLAISRSINWSANILHGLKDLSLLEEKMRNYPAAFRYMKEYVQLNDSIREDESKVRLHNLEMKYQASQKEKEILQLQNRNKQQQLVLQRSRFFNFLLLGGLLVAALTALLIYIVYRNKHRLNNFSAMLEGQEQERKRLARDLHDGLGGTMASIKLNVSQLSSGSIPPPEVQKVERIIAQLDEATRELRQIAHNMMPETLLKFGLETALKDLCEGMQHRGAYIVFQAHDLRQDIPQSEQIMVYRLVQELVNNALKHAGAGKILVQCLQRGQEMFITVEDDGRGFDISALTGKGNMGLTNIRTRVDYLKGKLDIQSTPGVGTTVNIEVNV
jgi:two-component system NarL family sensor kinase